MLSLRPGTLAASATCRNGPCVPRYSRSACARFSPTFGRTQSVSRSAVFRSTRMSWTMGVSDAAFGVSLGGARAAASRMPDRSHRCRTQQKQPLVPPGRCLRTGFLHCTRLSSKKKVPCTKNTGDFTQLLRRRFRRAHHAIEQLRRSTGIVIGEGGLPGGKAQLSRGIGGDDAVPRQMDQLCHLGAVGQNGQLLGRIACGEQTAWTIALPDTLPGRSASTSGPIRSARRVTVASPSAFSSSAVKGTCLLS